MAKRKRLEWPKPSDGVLERAIRKTSTDHYHKYVSSETHDHFAPWEWTWRSHAGSFPTPEAYLGIRVEWRCWWEFPREPHALPIRCYPVVIVIYDPAPWTVTGLHEERTRINAPVSLRNSWANSCNWGDTFNSMGD